MIHLERLLRARVEANELAGVVVAFSHADEGMRVLAHGHADRAHGVPFSADTIVRAYSMTKPIVAAAVLTLVQEGRVALDAPVGAFVPALSRLFLLREDGKRAPCGVPVTIRHLLTHTAGFVYPNPNGTATERAAWEIVGTLDVDLAGFVAHLAEAPLPHEPGEACTYGVSFDVLGRVIEVVTGEPLDRALRHRVLDPLDMRDTGFRVPREDLSRVAVVYRRDEAGALDEVAWPRDHGAQPRMLSGGGGLYSTARDYLAFARAILRPGFLHAATLEAMRAPHVCGASGGRIPGVGCAMGLGVRVVRDPTSAYGPRGAFGWDGLAGTTFMVDPARDVAVVCMTQVTPWPTGLHEAVRGATFA